MAKIKKLKREVPSLKAISAGRISPDAVNSRPRLLFLFFRLCSRFSFRTYRGRSFSFGASSCRRCAVCCRSCFFGFGFDCDFFLLERNCGSSFLCNVPRLTGYVFYQEKIVSGELELSTLERNFCDLQSSFVNAGAENPVSCVDARHTPFGLSERAFHAFGNTVSTGYSKSRVLADDQVWKLEYLQKVVGFQIFFQVFVDCLARSFKGVVTQVNRLFQNQLKFQVVIAVRAHVELADFRVGRAFDVALARLFRRNASPRLSFDFTDSSSRTQTHNIYTLKTKAKSQPAFGKLRTTNRVLKSLSSRL